MAMKKRITLADKWLLIEKEEKQINEAKVNEFFKDKEKPAKLFSVNWDGTVIEEADVEYCNPCYDRSLNKPYLYDKKPTRVMVQMYEENVATIQEAKEYDMFLHYRRKNTSGAVKYSNLDKEGWAFTADDLIEVAKKRKEAYAERDGHTACSYCRRQVPTDKMIKSTIIGRGRKQVWNSWRGRYESKAYVTRNEMLFCSKEHAAYAQMANEG